MSGDARETILARVLDNVPDAISVVDENDLVLLWNRAAQDLFGWTAAEVVGRPLPHTPDDAWAERSEGLLEVRTRRRHRDGRLLDVVIRYDTVPLDSGVTGVVSTYRAPTSELDLLDALHDGLAVLRAGRVVSWNRAAATLTGYPASEVLGHPPPLALEAAAEGIEVVTGDGSRWIQTVSTSVPSGETIYLIRDITEQRQLDVAKDLFFASTSHELKTPLTVVKGLAATMHHHWRKMTDAHREEAIDTILRRIDQLDLLIDRILVGSRVSAGVLDVQIGPTEVAPIITDMVRSFDVVSPHHDVRADLPAHLPLIAGDRQALDTVLGHLIENAVKYSPDGGTVVVKVRAEDRVVHVDVLDEGVGLEGDLEQLLRPFVQGDKRVGRRFGGVGIGLFIVQQLVEALAGQLTVSNRDPAGACFSFTLPVWQQPTT
jgi:PAS domain S-box-containing protein